MIKSFNNIDKFILINLKKYNKSIGISIQLNSNSNVYINGFTTI